MSHYVKRVLDENFLSKVSYRSFIKVGQRTQPFSEHIGCREIQEEILTETLEYLNDKQMNFYSVHSCEMLCADAIMTSGNSKD